MSHPLKIIVFDLDDTLLNTSETLLPAAQKESWTALESLGIKVPWSDFIKEWQSSYNSKKHGKDLIETFVIKLRDLGLIQPSKQMLEKVQLHLTKAFYGREVKEKLVLFEGAEEILNRLSENFILYLLTAGFQQTQRQKVQGLGIDSYFKGVLYSNLEKGEKKKDLFQRLLSEGSELPLEYLSVGNRRDTDIGPAKALGMRTCLLLKGEHLHQPAREENEIPDFEIEDIRDLIRVCQTLAPAFSLSATPPPKP